MLRHWLFSSTYFVIVTVHRWIWSEHGYHRHCGVHTFVKKSCKIAYFNLVVIFWIKMDSTLSFKLNCIVLLAYAFNNQGHKLKTPNSHDLSHVGEWLVFIDITYIQSARKNSSCLARQNEFHKSLNNGTFSRFKRFLTPYRTKDMKIKNFPLRNCQKNWLSHMTRGLPLFT